MKDAVDILNEQLDQLKFTLLEERKSTSKKIEILEEVVASLKENLAASDETIALQRATITDLRAIIGLRTSANKSGGVPS